MQPRLSARPARPTTMDDRFKGTPNTCWSAGRSAGVFSASKSAICRLLLLVAAATSKASAPPPAPAATSPGQPAGCSQLLLSQPDARARWTIFQHANVADQHGQIESPAETEAASQSAQLALLGSAGSRKLPEVRGTSQQAKQEGGASARTRPA